MNPNDSDPTNNGNHNVTVSNSNDIDSASNSKDDTKHTTSTLTTNDNNKNKANDNKAENDSPSQKRMKLHHSDNKTSANLEASTKQSVSATNQDKESNQTKLESDKKPPSLNAGITNTTSTAESTPQVNNNNNYDDANIPIVDVLSTHSSLNQQSQTPSSSQNNGTQKSRIEVKWEIIPEEVDQIMTQNPTMDLSSYKISRWWGANLISHDGTSYHVLRPDPDDDDDIDDDLDDTDNVNEKDAKTTPTAETNTTATTKSSASTTASTAVKAPIYMLDYDPYPEGGFPHRELSHVIFLNQHSLMDVDTNQSLWFRWEGSDWEDHMPLLQDSSTTSSALLSTLHNNDHPESNSNDIPLEGGENGLRSILDSVLAKALENSGIYTKMTTQMSAAQQCFMADRIHQAKERLLTKLMDTTAHLSSEDGKNNNNSGGGNKVKEITPELVRKCMEEIGTEGEL